MKTLFALLFLLSSHSATAGIIASALTGQPSLNLITAQNDFVTAFTSQDDYFQQFTIPDMTDELPASLHDNSLENSADRLGLISDVNISDSVFAVSDTVNSDNSSGWAEAFWTFDTSNHLVEFISIEFAAMGDFESSDQYHIDYQINAQPFESLYEIETDTAGQMSYRLASTQLVELNDPLTVNGHTLTNQFEAIESAMLNKLGHSLTLRFTARADSGAEVFALKGISILGTKQQAAFTSVPAPGQGGLSLLAGALLFIRYKHCRRQQRCNSLAVYYKAVK